MIEICKRSIYKQDKFKCLSFWEFEYFDLIKSDVSIQSLLRILFYKLIQMYLNSYCIVTYLMLSVTSLLLTITK